MDRNDERRLERAQAAAKGDEYAETIDFPIEWCTGAPLPHLFRSEGRALLAVRLNEPDPEWDGTYSTEVRLDGIAPMNLAIVEFEGCRSIKFGSPNDEALAGHALWGKGLEFYAAQHASSIRAGSRRSSESTAFTPDIPIHCGQMFNISFSASKIRHSNA